jgi:hypothetical protein
MQLSSSINYEATSQNEQTNSQERVSSDATTDDKKPIKKGEVY